MSTLFSTHTAYGAPKTALSDAFDARAESDDVPVTVDGMASTGQ